MKQPLTPKKVMDIGAKLIKDCAVQLPVEERLKGMKPEERLQGMKPQEILDQLDPALIEEYLRQSKPKKLRSKNT